VNDRDDVAIDVDGPVKFASLKKEVFVGRDNRKKKEAVKSNQGKGTVGRGLGSTGGGLVFNPGFLGCLELI
jgi:hypothetical protein